VIVHREGPGRRTPPSARPSSVPELSRLLRQTRAARGLPLDEASRQSGVALERLEDLESGTVDRLPDRVEILRDLSRYASFLGLPADQLVLSLVEAWPAGQSAAATAPVPTGASVTGTGAATAPVPTVAPQTTAIALTAARPRPPTPPSTIVVSDRHGSTAQVPVVMADTGRTPAVRASSDDGVAMALVRGLVVVLLVLLVVGTAWLVVDRVRPQWLADLHLPYSPAAPASSTVPGAPVRTTPTSTSPVKAAVRHPVTAPPSMRLVSATTSQATFAVTSSRFEVQISARGGETWVQATGPQRNAPSFVGILHNGQSQVVPADHALVVRIGSVAARIAVKAKGRLLGTYVPPGAPFVMTFTSQ